MKFLFVMDPLEQVKPEKDTSYFLMLGATQRGHEVAFADQNMISYRNGKVVSPVSQLAVEEDLANPFRVLNTTEVCLDEFDFILIRKDPPFDRRYFYTTLLLDLVGENTRVVNRPSSLRDWNEKLSALFFADLGPKTLISSQKSQIQEFVEQLPGKVVMKPIDGFGGKGILFTDKEDADFEKKVMLATHQESHKIVLQEYIPEAQQGDKRILLVDGEPIGSILRVHGEGEELNNLDQGGTAVPSQLTEREKGICERLKPRLQREGLFFVGIDILGDLLTEINVTSPTGLQELSQFDGKKWNHYFIECLEKKTAI